MSTLKIKRENGKIFCPLADSWHIETPEEKVRQEYIKILVENYGYSLDQMAQEIKVNNSQRGQGKARADIVIWKSKQDKIESKAAFIVVECKAENVRIREEDYYQGYNYASWAGASFFVTTNEKETKYFNVDKRCLRLLKKGGRMGMVLPEGVLNTSNLQKIREYFEGKAKIILICSIPQDVFIAAGATVKPSLVFFKRFTEEEELQYFP